MTAIAVHIYDVHKQRRFQVPDLNAAIAKLESYRRQYFSTWDDKTGERWERKGGRWYRIALPDTGGRQR